MCGSIASIAKTHSQSLEKDFSSEEFSLQGEPGLSFSKLSAHLGADYMHGCICLYV